MNDCKHEKWQANAIGLQFYCEKCGLKEIDLVKQQVGQLAAENAGLKSKLGALKNTIDTHGPEGRNYTNEQVVSMRQKYEAQNSAMRQSLERIKNIPPTAWDNEDTEWSIEAGKALAATAGTEYITRLEQAAREVVEHYNSMQKPGIARAAIENVYLRKTVDNLAAVLAEREGKHE